jgi:cation diffusion facilitator family transporter
MEQQRARSIVLFTHLIGFGIKFLGFVFSGSAVLMNESIHSLIDCVNQGLLVVGEKRALRERSDLYQFGEGRAVYFFSTVVAMTVFFGGGLFALIEAGRDLLDPTHEVMHIQVVAAILFASLYIEVVAVQSGWQEVKGQKRETQSLIEFLQDSRDADLLLGFTENLFALASVSVALIGILLTSVTGNAIFDSIGGILGGLLLLTAALFLGKEFYSLLIGESASQADLQKITTCLKRPEVLQINDLRTVHLSSDELLIVADIVIREQAELEPHHLIDQIDMQIKAALPELKIYCYIETEER